MAGTKRRTGRPKLTIISADGRMRSAPAPRRSPTTIDELPTRIFFTRGSSTPISGSLTVLRKYAEWLAQKRVRRLWVVGHANRRSWSKASRALADTRVRAVRDLLVWLGAGRNQVRRLSASRLHEIGAGSTRAVRAMHRSVELVVGPTGQLAVQSQPPRRRAPRRRRAA